MKRSSLIATAIGLSIPLGLSLPNALAADYTYTGTGNWYDNVGGNPNWSPNPNVPGPFDNTFFETAGRNAIVNGTVNYNAAAGGGDLRMGNGDSMVIDGGSWTQAAATGNWIKIGTAGTGTSVTIQNGGTLNMLDTAQRLRIGADGGSASFTVASNAGAGGLISTALTEVGPTSSLNINGGTNSLAGMAINGALNVAGGTTTVSGNIDTDTTTQIYIDSGTVTKTGTGNVFLNPSSTFQLSGGSFNMTGTGEFQPGAIATPGSQAISGNASLSVANIIAFQNAGAFNLSNSATITIAGTFSDGIYTAGGYINFTSINTGSSILFTGTGAGENNIFEGSIRYLGQSFTVGNYTTRFSVTYPSPGQTLITAIPEPSTYAVAIGIGCFGLIYLRRRKLATAA